MDTDEPEQPQPESDAPAGVMSLTPAERALLEEMKEAGWDESTYFERLYALKEREEEKRRVVVKYALGKFNFFLHLTAFLTGIAYLLLLGILYRPALPYVFIPIGLWVVGLGYHFYRAFYKPPAETPVSKPDRNSKPLGWIEQDADKTAGGRPGAPGDNGGDSGSRPA
jgi:hypothetical protein